MKQASDVQRHDWTAVILVEAPNSSKSVRDSQHHGRLEALNSVQVLWELIHD